jgi:hypothetical protein
MSTVFPRPTGPRPPSRHAGSRTAGSGVSSPGGVPGVTPWVKANRSADGGNCVELRRNAEAVEVRDSKDPCGPVLRFSAAGAAGWLHAAARGPHLDRLARG